MGIYSGIQENEDQKNSKYGYFLLTHCKYATVLNSGKRNTPC